MSNTQSDLTPYEPSAMAAIQSILENGNAAAELNEMVPAMAMDEDYVSFEATGPVGQSVRLFFLEIGERESRDEKGNSLGMKPAAIFLNPMTQKICFAQQAKPVGVLSRAANEADEAKRILPGTPVELVFNGIKMRKGGQGVYQDISVHPLRRPK